MVNDVLGIFDNQIIDNAFTAASLDLLANTAWWDFIVF